MKKHFILAAMAITALFTACNNEDDNLKNENEGKEVTFVIGGVDSRTTTTSDFTTSFVSGDAIGISSTGLSAEMSNVKYNVSVSDGSTTIAADGSTTYTYGEGNAIFNAYYPYDESFNNTFTVNTDQNTNGTAGSDFLTATATGSNDKAEVTLNFSHRMALVQVTLTGIDNISSVTLNGAKTTVTYTASTDGTTAPTLSTSEDNTANIIMDDVTANSVYWAIIPAQEIATGTLFQVTTSAGDVYNYTTAAKTSFAENNIYKYKLSVASNESSQLVSWAPVNIVAWANQSTVTEEEGELVEEKFSLTNIMPQSGQTFNTSSNFLNSTTAGGWVYNDVNAVTAETKDEKDCIKIKLTAENFTSSSWWKYGIAYMGNDLKLEVGEKYKLTFSMLCDTESVPVHAFVGYAEGGNKISKVGNFSDSSTLTGNTFKTCTNSSANTWVIYDLEIDPSYYGTGLLQDKVLTAQTETSVPFSICFRPAMSAAPTTDVYIYITDVKLIEN